MDPAPHKFYHIHGFHSRSFLDSYGSSKPEMAFNFECLKYPIKKFYDTFSSGEFKGDVLIDVTIGPFIQHLFVALEYFRDIILLKPSDHCIVEVKKWTDSRTGAFDWSHCSTLATEMEGNRVGHEHKEIKLREAITHVVKFNLNKENLTDPIKLPQADCLVFWSTLDCISKDLEDYVRNFKRFSKLLKPGGRLILYGSLNSTFLIVGGEKFHMVKLNENDLRSMLINEGFVITHFEVTQKLAVTDLIDFDSIVFCTAYKEQAL
ncbi:nicotinamide N-methyltransferase-like [Lithobates pipiens]